MNFDEMLKRSAENANEAMLNSLPSKKECEHKFSTKVERKILQTKPHTAQHIVYRTLKQVACVILAVLVSGTIWLSVDDTARAEFSGWVNEISETQFSYRYEGEEKDMEWDDYRPTWIPRDFVETEVVDMGTGSVTVYYVNETGTQQSWFSYTLPTDQGGAHLFNNYGMTYKTTKVNGVTADLIIANSERESNSIVWTDPDTNIIFEITAFLDEEDLVRMAESVKAVEK